MLKKNQFVMSLKVDGAWNTLSAMLLCKWRQRYVNVITMTVILMSK